MKTNYKEKTEQELNKTLKELKMMLIKTHGITERKKTERPEYRKKFKKEIARILTELRRRRWANTLKN